MSSQETTSSGYFTGKEGSQESRVERTPTYRASQRRFCPECNCYLEAISREITDLQEDNRRLRCQILTESELARQEQYHRMNLEQVLDKTKRKHKDEMDHLHQELNRLKAELASLRLNSKALQESARCERYRRMDLQQIMDKTNRKHKEELDHLQKKLDNLQMDGDGLKEKLSRSEWKRESLVQTAGLLHQNAERLKQKLADSEKKRARAEQTMLTYKSLVSDITDEAAQLDAQVQQLQNSHTELRETTFRAFCKVRPSLLDLHKVIIHRIPNSRENTQMWLEFLTALNMRHTDICTLVLSECDARWNVHSVLAAWLNGRGSEPKTWGTLLNAMRERGTPFLRELADAAEDVYLRKLASLRLSFDVCCVCWQAFSSTIATECSESPDSQRLSRDS